LPLAAAVAGTTTEPGVAQAGIARLLLGNLLEAVLVQKQHYYYPPGLLILLLLVLAVLAVLVVEIKGQTETILYSILLLRPAAVAVARTLIGMA
jgi:hypothetical protein